jgi:hypothetical protein
MSAWLPSKPFGSKRSLFTCPLPMKANQLSPDFKEFVELLNAHGVEYLIVGAFAVARYCGAQHGRH